MEVDHPRKLCDSRLQEAVDKAYIRIVPGSR
jgi:hypothetical protein